MAFPRCHCAFRGCAWARNKPLDESEAALAAHIRDCHLHDMQLEHPRNIFVGGDPARSPFMAVSYTHLTLPTKRIV